MPQYIAAIDQGTTSSRCMIFDENGKEISRHQLEHRQILPQPGWVEHDPIEIIERINTVVHRALKVAGLTGADITAIGITNQRETTVVWDATTGEPLYHAIVWQDTRNHTAVTELASGPQSTRIRELSGLPPATYFSAGKIKWLIDNEEKVAAAAAAGTLRAGTIDSWIVFNLTGGQHLTDVTNASRTQLMNLKTLDWDEELLSIFAIGRNVLPEIVPSINSQPIGLTSATSIFGNGIPIHAIVGDQQAAMIGQLCFNPGDIKNTYGTGNFLLLNTGTEIVRSNHGLLTTVCYQIAGDAAVYALEGSIAVTGSAIQWLRDQLGIISGAAQSESLANEVPDNGGVVFVPAFSGLFAPHWRPDARGAIVGLSRFNTNAHIARATLEAICYQSKDVVDAMIKDAGVTINSLKVDGGVTENNLCMQIQADILGIDVSRPEIAETTALGACYGAGLGAGIWADPSELSGFWQESKRWSPQWDTNKRTEGFALWSKAIERSLNWV